MSFILFRKQIGQQAVLPGELLMESTDDLVAITTPGYLSINDGILPTDVITAVYGTPMVNKQQFNPVISGGVVTLVAIGGGGSINGATNLPGDEPIFAGVLGDSLAFKSLTAGANITLFSSGDTITIAATGSGGGTITGLVDVGDGQGHISAGNAGSLAQVKTIKAGTNVVITEDSDTVTIASTASATGLTGLANLPGGEGIYASTIGSIATLKSIAAGAGIGISSTADTIVISNEGSGGGGFEYQNAQWVAKNGNDANDGKSINTPKLTVQAAITALGGDGVINIVDNGSYTGAWNIGTNNVTINAPAAFLNTSGVTVGSSGIFNVIAYSFGSNFANMFPSSSGATVFINAQKVRGNIGDGVTNPSLLFIEAQEISGDYTFASTVTAALISASSMAGNIIDTSPAAPTLASIYVYLKNNTGNITSTNRNIAGYLGFSSGTPTITGIRQGYFDGIDYEYNIPTVGEIYGEIYTSPPSGSWSFVPGQLNGNGLIVVTNTSSGGVTMPPASSVPLGYRLKIIQSIRSSGAAIRPQGNDTLCGQPSSDSTVYTGRGACEIIRGPDNGEGGFVWIVTGDVFGSNLTSFNIFVSQVSGSDTLGDGTLESPYATIQFAVTTAGTPATPTSIVIIDGATYNEAVTVSQPNIYIIGPEALLTHSGGVDALTFTTNGTQHLVNLGGIIASGGSKALNNTGTSTVVSTGETMVGDVQTNNGQIQLRGVQLSGNFASIGSGFIRYTATSRSGVDGTNVVGINPLGASSDFAIAGQLTADGKLYDTTSGSPLSGYVMTYDGASTISLQAPSAPAPSKYFTSNPVAFLGASITLDGTFLGDRVIVNNNVGPCSWTMDTGANLTAAFPDANPADTFVVYVYNSTGATITLTGASGSNVIGSGSNLEFFILTLRYAGGSTWDIYI